MSNDEFKEKVTALQNSIPMIKELFHIHMKVGEGTFSSVYLATLKSSEGSKEYKRYALKYLVPTCHIEKIERELQCLKEIGGQDHVVGLECCLRNQGSVVFVMPYMRHDKFSEYIKDMTVQETRDYMRALLVALRRVHQFNIIHRDVKPSNFLYDRINKRYLLVDFGLAQKYTPTLNDETIVNNTIQSVKRKRFDENSKDVSGTSDKIYMNDQCACFGKPKTCSLCLNKRSQVAPRAGTPGFRAPEVLLKYSLQTPAIDIWASGIIMLCILSATQPFFRSPDDCTALAEIISVFGTQKLQQCAQKLGKKLITSENLPGIDLMTLCQKLQKRNRDLPHNSNYKKMPSSFEEYPKEAYQLLKSLLDVNHKTRITAEQALEHPFFKLSL
ncbi:PREDICTED: cell division cycle 7-related protein kinase-like isoform X2 [Polistes dominula]|uniref:non-specific serine/threonine protein kinase n=1 Tax=Polistes dominula TaxID=743375 RepID=A0ABM1IAI1_POLDO|nr:PREDICTED: cell division cycle 7-related protein kinase-like isoform X2 [Polistes dominula]